MSHNINTLNGAEPNRAGAITQTVGDLSDVNLNAVGASQVLQYNNTSSVWENAAMSGGSASYIWIGGDYSDAYQNSPHGTGAFSGGNTLYVYNNNATVNTIAGSTVTATANWVESITLPAGEYFVQGQTMLAFSASGYAAYRWETSGGGRVSQYGVVGESRGGTYGASNSNAVGYIDLSAQTVIKLVLKAQSSVDTGANQGSIPAQYGFIYIEKLA